MTPNIGLLTPVKAAFGEWLGQFYAAFQPDTPANVEWKARGQAKAMAWVPGRMVDAVEDMLSSWRTNANSDAASTSAYLPALFVAFASDYTETPSEQGRPITDKLPFTFPSDTVLKRSFRLRLMRADCRAQVVVVANDPLSAMSIIGQLSMAALDARAFPASFGFAGQTADWPVQIVAADRMAIPTPVGEHLTVLTVDFTLRASIPLFYGLDGYTGANVDDPGQPVLEVVVAGHDPAITRPAGVSAEEWRAFQILTGAELGPATDDGSAPGVVLCNVSDATEGA